MWNFEELISGSIWTESSHSWAVAWERSASSGGTPILLQYDGCKWMQMVHWLALLWFWAITRKMGIIWKKGLYWPSTVLKWQHLTFLNFVLPSSSLELGIYRSMLTRTHSRVFEVKRNWLVLALPYSRILWRALNLVNQSSECIWRIINLAIVNASS